MKNTTLWAATVTLLRVSTRGGAAIACAMTLLSSPAHAEGYPGFGLNASRLVVMGDAKGGALITALNNSDNVYLVQSRVYPAQGLTGYPSDKGGGTPFLVTPPLKRMGPQSRLPLRILVTPQSTLPQDRESLFFLSAKAIPSVSPPDAHAEKNANDAGGAPASPRVVMALQQFIKLYYRPAGLKPHAIFDGDVAQHLTMRLSGKQLHVDNPTPYYITFGLLKVNGKTIDQKALRVLTPPMGGQDYPLPASVTHGTVEWQVIDEFGLVTKLQTRALR